MVDYYFKLVIRKEGSFIAVKDQYQAIHMYLIHKIVFIGCQWWKDYDFLHKMNQKLDLIKVEFVMHSMISSNCENNLVILYLQDPKQCSKLITVSVKASLN
jgi:hypothetical protein